MTSLFVEKMPVRLTLECTKWAVKEAGVGVPGQLPTCTNLNQVAREASDRVSDKESCSNENLCTNLNP